MTFTVAIVLGFFGLLFVILIHEAGHYVVARAFGFKVQEYFVGFGPRLWSFRRNGIEYGIKAIPAGGYVKIAGMNPYETVSPEDLPRSYGAKPRWQRALVILAGPATHLVVGVVLFMFVFMFVGDPNTNVPIVGQVVTKLGGVTSPAYDAGLRAGDRIVAVGDLQNPTRDQLQRYTTVHVGQALDYTILRDGSLVHLTMTPVLDSSTGKQIGRVGVLLGPAKYGFLASIPRSAHEVQTTIANAFSQIGRVFGPEGIARAFRLLFTNTPRQTTDPTTVVGLGRAVGEGARQNGFGVVLAALAYLTVFVGLLNLIPLPPFDGGHLAVLVIEKVRGRTIDMKKLIPVSAVVIAFFGTFVFMTLLLDIFKPLPTP